jgi:hypothetical protein
MFFLASTTVWCQKIGSHMSHITTLQLSEIAGITKRHCQRLLVAGRVPDAVRTNGGHWMIPDNAKVRKWCKKTRDEKHQRPAVKLPAKRKTNDKVPAAPVGNDLDECLANLAKARKQMRHAIELARGNAQRAGALLIASYNLNQGGKWRPWLAANGYDESMIDLMHFARWSEKESHGYMDTTILKKFGLVEKSAKTREVDRQRKLMKSTFTPWIAWTGKLTAHFGEVAKQNPPSHWDVMDRISVAEQLRPIAEFYAKLSK